MAEFADIRIIDLEERLSERIDPRRELFRVHFKLSAEPEPEWEDLFEQQREWPRHSLWRKARVSGKYIVVECSLSEIEMHKADLDEDVANANAAYRKKVGATVGQEAKEEKKAKDDGSLIAGVRKKLFG